MRHYNLTKEVRIYRYMNGICLSNPESPQKFSSDMRDVGYSIKDIDDLPFCLYLLNKNSVLQTINERTAEICRFQSTKKAIGQSMYDVAEKESAEKVIRSDKFVMQSQQMHIIEDDVVIKNKNLLQCLSLKFPWYNHNNKVIGVFGCTMLIEKQSIATSLSKMLGLLNPTINKSASTLSNLANNPIYLSRREKQCANLLIRGKTAKEIAAQLNLSHRTIEFYIENIKNKLHVSTKSELIDKLMDMLISP